MLDLPRLMRIRLTSRPRAQRLVGWALLVPNYEIPPRVRIDVEGLEHLPNEPVLLAMNHTDRYNYWPLQYALWRRHDRFTATWVKGKYYQSAFVGKFMELTNNIPTVSRGYLISRDFINTMGRPPGDEEYAALRQLVEDGGAPPASVPNEILERPRDMLGRPFDPSEEPYPEAVDALFRAMMRRFVELNGEAFDKGLDVLVFPQGTRSKRLSRGHIGLAQIALKFDRPIVPVGCSGSDACYPSGSPLAKGGHIVYRVGAPITREELAPFRPSEAFEPFTPEAEQMHRERFQSLVDVVMDRINDLVDAPYKRSDTGESDGTRGVSRFV
jgi:1-acyl-sn-glycerol-3-phosphate acyltransferase